MSHYKPGFVYETIHGRFLVMPPQERAQYDSVFVLGIRKPTEVSQSAMDDAGAKPVGMLVTKDAVQQALNIGVVLRVVDWWLSLRPEGMTEEAHLENPTVGTKSEEEAAMARAIARLTQEPLKVFP